MQDDTFKEAFDWETVIPNLHVVPILTLPLQALNIIFISIKSVIHLLFSFLRRHYSLFVSELSNEYINHILLQWLISKSYMYSSELALFVVKKCSRDHCIQGCVHRCFYQEWSFSGFEVSCQSSWVFVEMISRLKYVPLLTIGLLSSSNPL